MKRLGIVGIPIETGQTQTGLKLGPDFIRGTDLTAEIEKLGYIVSDYGNMEMSQISEDCNLFNAKLPKTFAKNCLNCRTMVKHALSDSDCLLLLGGDRTMSTGSILGHSRMVDELCVISVSSQPNLHNPLSLENGNMNRMPFFLLVDNMQDEIPWMNDFKNIPPILPASSFGIIGIHGVDNYERYVIDKCSIKATSIDQIDRIGIEAAMNELLMTVDPGQSKSIHLCFNCDALDVMFGPSTADSKKCGLTFREAIKICEILFATGNLRVIEISEVNPAWGSFKETQTTRDTIMHLILATLGAKRRGIPKIDHNYYSWKENNLPRGARFM